MDIEMPFAHGRPCGPSGVWGSSTDNLALPVESHSSSKRSRSRPNLSVVVSSDLSLSRSPSPLYPTPRTPDLIQHTHDRPRSTSSISTILPGTPDSVSDDGHAITSTIKALPLSSDYFHDNDEDESSEEAYVDSRQRYYPNQRAANFGYELKPHADLNKSSESVTSVTESSATSGRPSAPDVPIPAPSAITAISASSPPISTRVVAHGDVAARKVVTPLVPAPANSMTGKKGYADIDLASHEFGTLSLSPSPMLHGSPMAPHSTLAPSAPRRAERARVSFAHPLFAISERAELIPGRQRERSNRAASAQTPANVLTPTSARQAVPQPPRSNSGPTADDGTVNRWPWGARRVTPIPAEVVAAVRSRGSV